MPLSCSASQSNSLDPSLPGFELCPVLVEVNWLITRDQSERSKFSRRRGGIRQCSEIERAQSYTPRLERSAELGRTRWITGAGEF